jgi:hypothetical protein
MMPSSAELARIREDMQATTLPDVGNILALSQSRSGGRVTETWGTVTVNVPCRVDLFTSRGVGIIGSEKLQSAAIKPYSTWILSVPHGTAITNANRFEFNGNTYNVTEVDTGRSWGANVRATLEKV